MSVKSFSTAVEETLGEELDGKTVEEQYIEFEIDGRTLRAFHPTPGQLVFMLAAMGHGQSAEQRFAGILNIVFAALRDEDRDYVEARLLSRDPKDRKFHETLEGVFEFLAEEWFATPTEQPSDSAE